MIGKSQLLQRSFDDRLLPAKNLRHRTFRREPSGAVDFRKFRRLSRARRPLHRKQVASDRGRIAIGFNQPGRDDLSAWLLEVAQCNEIAVDAKARLLGKLALCRFEGRFAFFVEAFGDRPRAHVLLRTERSARMHEEELKLWPATAKQQQSRAANHSTASAFCYCTVTETDVDGMPFATTTRELAPVCIFAGTSKLVEMLRLPVATPIEL